MSFLTSTAFAQSDKQAQQGQDQQQPEKAKTEQVKKDKPGQQKEGNVSDTFTPSEEISEDLAVSFPVDI